MIRLAAPDIGADDIEAVAAVLRSGYLVQGERVRAFEERVAGFVGARHAIAVSNCTAALHLSLMALGIGPGDGVAVTTYSWPATANVIVLCGAEPVFVDIEANGFTMDPRALATTLERADRIKAVLPVHTFGGMADMQRILEIATHYDVPVVEDAACALGARCDARFAGTMGRVGCFSFHPRKAITTGEGGMIVTDDDDVAHRLRVLRNHGQDPDAASPDFIGPGYNCRLTDVQGALGVTQMAKLDRIIAARRTMASCYDTLFAGTPVRPPIALPGVWHVYQTYAVLLPEQAAPYRAEIIATLRARDIEVNIGTHHMPLIRYLRERYGFTAGDFPVSDEVAARIVALPLHSGLSDADQELVAAELLAAIESVPSTQRHADSAVRS
jgi:dTDP-4-amino-4,6-dideoxygalactose transaminase